MATDLEKAIVLFKGRRFVVLGGQKQGIVAESENKHWAALFTVCGRDTREKRCDVGRRIMGVNLM